WPVPRRGQPADEVLGVESEIGRIRPQVALRVHRGGEVAEILRLERLEMLAPDSRRSRNLVDREAALAALRSERLSDHSIPRRSSKSSTSGSVIKTSRDLEPW